MVKLSRTFTSGRASLLVGALLTCLQPSGVMAQDTSDGSAKAMSMKAMPMKAAGAKPAAAAKKAPSGNTMQGGAPAAAHVRPRSAQPGHPGGFNRAYEASQGGATNTANSGAIRAYCNKTWGKINNNWDYANGHNHVVLGVDLDGGGNVLNMHATSSPHNTEAEGKAQAALQRSQPLDVLPSGLPSAHLTITFDSTADPHGDSNSSGSVKLECNPNGASAAASSAPPPASEPAATHEPAQQAPAQEQPAAQQPAAQQPAAQQQPTQQQPAQQGNPAGGAGGDPFK